MVSDSSLSAFIASNTRRSGTETDVSGSDDPIGPQTRGDSSHSRGAVELHQYVEEALPIRGDGLLSIRL